MLPGDAPMMPVGLRANELVPQGRETPVDGVLEGARDGAVVFGGHKEDAVSGLDGFLEGAAFRWEVSVIVVAVQREVLDGNLGEFQLLRREFDQGLGQDPVDGAARQAAYEVSDLVRCHELSFPTAGPGRLAEFGWKRCRSTDGDGERRLVLTASSVQHSMPGHGQGAWMVLDRSGSPALNEGYREPSPPRSSHD